MSNKYITTQCGLNKYEELKIKTGIFNSIRFYWFVFFASIRDTSFSKSVSLVLNLGSFQFQVKTICLFP